jgi:anti-sigma factor RsiW
MNRHVEDRIQAWLDGELTAAEARSVEAHVESCERCARAADASRRVMRAIDSLEQARPLAPMWPRVERSLHRGPGLRFDPPFAAATAAALVAGVMLGVLTFDRSPAPIAAGGGTAEAEWTIGSSPTLAEIYLDESSEEEESP